MSSLNAAPFSIISTEPIRTQPAQNSQNLSLETLTLPEQSPIATIAQAATLKPAQKSSPTLANAQKTSTTARPTVCSSYYGYLLIGSKTICLSSTNTTAGSLSYSNAYIFNNASYASYNQYIFGHNSSNLFGVLSSLPSGTKFSLTIQNQTQNYTIAFSETTCDYTNPSHPCSNYPEAKLNMKDAIYPTRRGADLAIMTCAGQGIGGGDATHRLTVYAKRI